MKHKTDICVECGIESDDLDFDNELCPDCLEELKDARDSEQELENFYDYHR